VTRPVHSRLPTLAFGLVVVQIADTLASAIPQMSTAARLDHLGFPHALRSLLPTIKVSASLGILVGLRWAPVGTVTSAGLVAFYSSAVGFHRLAGDHPAAALPAATIGIASTLCFFEYLSCSSPQSLDRWKVRGIGNPGGPPGSRSRHLGIKSRGPFVLSILAGPFWLVESSELSIQFVRMASRPRISVATQ